MANVAHARYPTLYGILYNTQENFAWSCVMLLSRRAVAR